MARVFAGNHLDSEFVKERIRQRAAAPGDGDNIFSHFLPCGHTAAPVFDAAFNRPTRFRHGLAPHAVGDAHRHGNGCEPSQQVADAEGAPVVAARQCDALIGTTWACAVLQRQAAVLRSI